MAVPTHPLVSIITRTRDRHALLRRALESVLSQELEAWEQIVVNDGGDAASLDKLLESYAERYKGRLKIIHNPQSLGMQAASNKALELARGTYVSVHDDDDAWSPEFLLSTVGFLEEQGAESPYKGVITHTVRVWEDVDARGNVVEVEREDYLPLPEINLLRTGFENPFPPIAFLYRREVHDTIGLFDQAFDVAGDLDFNVRFLLRYEIGVIPRKLAYYHWRRKSKDRGLHNSVTAHAREHGRRLNEWMNHYLRSHAEGDAARLAPALNMARHLVATQGKADQAIERIGDLKLFTGDAIQALTQELARLDEYKERLADIKKHLGSLTGIGEGTYPLIQDLKEHLNSLNGQIAQQQAAISAQERCFTDLKEHLSSFNGVLDTMQNTQLPGIKEHLAGISWVQEQHVALHQANEARLQDLKEHLTSVSNAMVGDLMPRVNKMEDEQGAMIAALREEIAGMRASLDEYSKEWRIFGLRLRWKGGKKSK